MSTFLEDNNAAVFLICDFDAWRDLLSKLKGEHSALIELGCLLFTDWEGLSDKIEKAKIQQHELALTKETLKE
jgi:hypothetical protein